MQPPTIVKYPPFVVVRDDLVFGGTKERALLKWLPNIKHKVLVYASPAHGYAQLALARACLQFNKKAIIFTAHRRILHDRTLEAQEHGAKVHKVPNGYLTVVQKAARVWAQEHGAYLVPFGLDCPEFIKALVEEVTTTPYMPKEVWCAVGSGTLCRALQQAWPKATVHAVLVGKKDPNIGNAIRHVYPRPFTSSALDLPPFPSCPEYDAKAWELMRKAGKPGALFWNVAGRKTGA